MLRNHWVCLAAGTAIGGLAGATLVSATDSGLVMLGTDGRLQWETLLTGAVALGAAWGTINAVRDQIRQSKDQEQGRLNRQARAARAVLSLALTQLADYGDACVSWLKDIRDASGSRQTVDRASVARVAKSRSLPTLPHDALLVLKECIAAADDEPADAMSALVQIIQIQKVRFIRWVESCQSPHFARDYFRREVSRLVIDSVELIVRIDHLFRYARTNEIGAPIELHHMKDKLTNLLVDEVKYKDIFDTIETWNKDRFEKWYEYYEKS